MKTPRPPAFAPLDSRNRPRPVALVLVTRTYRRGDGAVHVVVLGRLLKSDVPPVPRRLGRVDLLARQLHQGVEPYYHGFGDFLDRVQRGPDLHAFGCCGINNVSSITSVLRPTVAKQ